MRHCSSGKRRYPDKLAAMLGVSRMIHPHRVYECPNCKGYHTTANHADGRKSVSKVA